MSQDANPNAGWTADYYDQLADKEWDRLQGDPAGLVSFFIHAHYLKQFVPRGSRVLEIGPGPGRFTEVLAQRECQVVVGDISPVQLSLHQGKASERGFESAVESSHLLDICDLGAFESDSFDAVVCYGGPLSYVFAQAPQAMAECARVCKPGGSVLASVMSMWGTSHRYLDGVLDIPLASNRRITDTGDLTPDNCEGVNHRCHMFRSGELRELAQGADLEVTAMSASSCLVTNWAQPISDLEPESAEWQEILRMELEASAEPGCIDMGTHMILVGKKV